MGGDSSKRAGGSISRRRRVSLRRLIRTALFVAVVAGVFLGALPKIADLGRVWTIFRSVTWREDLLLVVVAVLNIVTYWPMLVAAMPGLSLAQAAVVCQSSTTVAMTVPAGGAVAVGVSYTMYSSWGFRRSEVARSAVITGIGNVFIKLAMPITALAFLAAEHEESAWLVSSAVTGIAMLLGALVLLFFIMRDEALARRLGSAMGRVASWARRLLGRDPVETWGEVAARFRRQVLELLRTRWLFLVIPEIVSQTALYLVLLVSLRVVGVQEGDISWSQALAVFSIVRLGTAFPVIPGNIGLVELGYIGGLLLVGGTRVEVVAAVLLFRLLTFYLQIPVGGITYLMWKRNRSWRRRLHEVEPAPVAELEAAVGARGAASD